MMLWLRGGGGGRLWDRGQIPMRGPGAREGAQEVKPDFHPPPPRDGYHTITISCDSEFYKGTEFVLN